MNDPAAKPIRCPRCAYDQRGALATWGSSCPLKGRCTECGLTFRWAEVLRPDKFEPQWCVEHARGLGGAVRGVGLTLLRSSWPFGFFRALKMTDRLCAWRLCFYLFSVLLLVLACYAFSQSVLASVVRFRIGSEPGITQVQHPYPVAVYEAVTAPLGRFSSGQLWTTSGAYAYPPPRTLPRVAASLGPRGRGWFDLEPMMPAAFLLLYGSAPFVFLPACFVLLPISRRRAKVRWAHVWRVAAYSFALPLVAAATGFLVLTVSWLRDDWLETLAAGLALAIVAGLPLGLVCWWAAAIKRYLRIPHAWFVAVSLTVLCALLTPAIVVLLTTLLRVDAPGF